jgi:hypothetical protein
MFVPGKNILYSLTYRTQGISVGHFGVEKNNEIKESKIGFASPTCCEKWKPCVVVQLCREMYRVSRPPPPSSQLYVPWCLVKPYLLLGKLYLLWLNLNPKCPFKLGEFIRVSETVY